MNFNALEAVASYAYSPRIVNNVGSDVTGVTATNFILTHLGYSQAAALYVGQTTTIPLDASKTLLHPIWPIAIANMPFGFLGGDISTSADVWLTTYNYGTHLDEVTYGGNQYVIWISNNSGARRLAIRKG